MDEKEAGPAGPAAAVTGTGVGLCLCCCRAAAFTPAVAADAWLLRKTNIVLLVRVQGEGGLGELVSVGTVSAS